MKWLAIIRGFAVASVLLCLRPDGAAYGQAPDIFVDSPAGTTPACSQNGQWLLLYWKGADRPIATAAAACPSADRLWASSGGRWLGFAPSAPKEANDEFSVVTGQALFVHGGSQPSMVTLTGTLTFVVGDPAGGGSPATRYRLVDDQGQILDITIDNKTQISGPLSILNGRRVRIVGDMGAGGAVLARSIEPVS